MEDRLQKILSMSGICSRRAAETYILDGRVTVNGSIANLGDKADLDVDEICVDGTVLGGKSELVYIMLNKPKGFVTTLDDEQNRPTVAELVASCGVRVWPVGRLDLNSEGLLIMTNDGDLTHKLIHPSHEVEKEYLVRATGDITAGLPILSGPIELDGVKLRPARVRQISPTTLSVVIHEGKNRQIRRMCELASLRVNMLRRVREGELQLGELLPRQWRYLSASEVATLKKL